MSLQAVTASRAPTPAPVLEFSANEEAAGAEMTSLVTLLGTVALMDGHLDAGERHFLEGYVNILAAHVPVAPGGLERVRRRLAVHFDAVLAGLETEIAELRDGVARGSAGGERAAREYVQSRLRIKALEIFSEFTPRNQKVALIVLELLLRGDGAPRPQEEQLYRELVRALTAPRPSLPAPIRRTELRRMQLQPAVAPPLAINDHPFLDPLEHRHSTHPVELSAQLARDQALADYVIGVWNRQREAGFGRLANAQDISEIPANRLYLDRFTYALNPAARNYMELVVLGDLHGCYSCLKAALLQSNFLDRVWAHQREPERYPDVKLVLLGDYLDRGRFGFDGVLRTVLQLFAVAPDNVILLRGNHEDFRDHGGYITSAVYPADSIATLAPNAPYEVLDTYRALFEAMPTAFVCGRTFLVHGGMPRFDSFSERFRDLGSLNDPEMRFQMMWSDPSATAFVPVEMQRQNPRFSFGRDQFRVFMERIGCATMVRGHERFEHGFHLVYDADPYLLLSLFSAGGAANVDLPAESPYRATPPMAATIQFHSQGETLTPWLIDWAACNNPMRNGFLRERNELPARSW